MEQFNFWEIEMCSLGNLKVAISEYFGRLKCNNVILKWDIAMFYFWEIERFGFRVIEIFRLPKIKIFLIYFFWRFKSAIFGDNIRFFLKRCTFGKQYLFHA